jgi:hypothetical protein
MPSSVSISPALQQELANDTFNTRSDTLGYTLDSPSPSAPVSYDPKRCGLFSLYWYYNSSSNGTIGQFRLFQGTPPLDIAAVDQNERVADVLITWQTSELTFTRSGGAVQLTGSSLRNPTANGTATWFMWDIMPGPTLHRLIGTVGLIDSGADFELNDTVLSTATQYRIFGSLELAVPTEFTYG